MKQVLPPTRKHPYMKNGRKLLSLLLSMVMLVSMLVPAAAAVEQTVADTDALAAAHLVSQQDRPSGLVGFEGDYALEESGEMISVIVEFCHQPAALVQAISEAAGERNAADSETLTEQAEADADAFFSALSGVAYTVEYTYHTALNGVSIQLPQSYVDDIADLACVFAVYPNETYENAGGSTEVSYTQGMGDSHAYFGTQALHSAGYTGEGVTVGVIDTGVDYKHPDLAGAFAATLPNGKTPAEGETIDGIFYGRNYINNGNAANDPMDDHGHGSHVSGTIAARGIGNGSFSALGVAPGAKLAVYKALNHNNSCQLNDVVKAMEDAVADGCRILSMSLGWSSANGTSHATSLALNSLALQNPDVLFVLCAGNNGSKDFTLWSPGTSPLALTVANAQIPSDSRLLTASNAAGQVMGDLRLIRSGWGDAVTAAGGRYTLDALTADEQGHYQLVLLPTVDGAALGTGTQEEFDAFFAERTASDYAGSLFVVSRGQAFDDVVPRIRAAVGTGALLVLNTEARANDFANISFFQGYFDNYLPVFTMQYDEGQAFVSGLTEGETYGFTFSDANSLTTTNAVAVSGFPNSGTSRGPVKESYDLKPDLAAPGTAVVSLAPGGGYTNMSGTSMATPHVSAIAALVMQKANAAGKHLTALELKSLLVNTANAGAFGGEISRFAVGNGMVDPAAALAALDQMVTVTATNPNGYNNSELDVNVQTPTISFGGVQAGGPLHKTMTVTVTNSGATSHTYSLVLSPAFHAAMHQTSEAALTDQVFSLSTSSITVAAGESAVFELTLSLDETAEAGTYETTVFLSEGGTTLSAAAGAYVYQVDPILADPVDLQYTFIHNNVLSSGPDMQLKYYGWHGSDRTFYHFRFKDGTIETWQPLLYTRDGQLVGQIDGWYSDAFGRWDWYYYDTIGATWFTPCTLDAEGNVAITGEKGAIPEGAYKMKLLLKKTGAAHRLVEVADLYIDNTLPVLMADTSGSWSGVCVGDTVTYTGSIYDAGTQEMMELGINSTADYRVFGNTTSQKDNVVVLQVGETYYRADVAADGSFTIQVPAEDAQGTATVFYGDHFLPIGSDSWYGYFYEGFTPNDISYTVETSVDTIPYMTCYGYRAANMASYEVELSYTTPPAVPEGPVAPVIPSAPSKPNLPEDSGVCSGGPDCAAYRFADVTAADWFHLEVDYVLEQKLFDGVSATAFQPGGSMTRAMAWTVLGRMKGQQFAGTGNGWYQQAQQWAVEQRISDGSAPNDSITRQQFVTMLWRCAGENTARLDALARFGDADDVSGYALTAMAWAVENGILEGNEGTLQPRSCVTRAEAAAILMRFCQLGR